MGPATVAGETQAAVRPSMAGSSLWAAVSQVATLGVQGIAALVILLLFGKGSDTDAVFAAYGLYGVVVLMCQTLRLTVVARLVEEPSPWAAFDRFLGAGLSMVAMAIAVQLVFGATIARVLTGDLGQHAQDLVRSTLNVLCIGVVGQLVAALGAAVLAVRQEFRYSGLAYVAGGLTSVIVLVALHGSLDIRAAPVGVAVGSTLSAGLMVVRLWRDGYRPGLARLLAGARHPRTAVLLLIGSVGPLLGQLNFVISLAFAARLGPGMVTLYTGAFFAGAVIVAVTGSAVSLVLAAPIAQTWDGRAAARRRICARSCGLGSSSSAPRSPWSRWSATTSSGCSSATRSAPPTSISPSACSSCSADSRRHARPAAAAVAAFAQSGTAPWRGWPRWARPSIFGDSDRRRAGTITRLAAAASLSSLTTMTILLWLIHRSQVLSACGSCSRRPRGWPSRPWPASLPPRLSPPARRRLVGQPCRGDRIGQLRRGSASAFPEHAAVAERMFGAIVAGALRRARQSARRSCEPAPLRVPTRAERRRPAAQQVDVIWRPKSTVPTSPGSSPARRCRCLMDHMKIEAGSSAPRHTVAPRLRRPAGSREQAP